jgi:hypothetical protein
MRRVAVIGPNPPCGALSGERFVELLADKLGLEAFSLRPAPGLALAAGADTQFQLPARAASGTYIPTIHVEADTLIWLRFPPQAYLRDWFAGWFDVLLNGAPGSRRRSRRAHLSDFVRACVAMLQKDAISARQLEGLRPQIRFLELSSPEQVFFWLQMQEERARESD